MNISTTIRKSINKIHFGVLCFLMGISYSFSQNQYAVGAYVEDSLTSFTWSNHFSCYPNPDFGFVFPENTVTGMDYIMVVTDVSAVDNVYTSLGNTLNVGDTLWLDDNIYQFYFPQVGSVSLAFKAIGTPEVAGETYDCGYVEVFFTLANCDNTVVFDFWDECVTQSCNTQYQITEVACESFMYNDIAYTESGIYPHSYLGLDGCDSIVSLNLTILHQIDSTFTVSTCESFTLNGETYTESGQYFKSFSNALGCDSFNLTINLEINHADTISITETVCDNYTFNNETYTETGIYNQLFTSSAGCDSIVSLDLMIKQSSSNSITTTACDDYFINDNVYDESGVYTIMLENSVGCDSVVTLNLTINEIDVTVEFEDNTIIATESATSYQWIECSSDFEPIEGAVTQDFECNESGVYAVVMTNGECSATSDCIEVLVILDDTQLGFNESNVFSLINIYPNPNSGHFKVEFGEIQMPVSLRVHDVLGRVIEQIDQYNGSSYEFNLPQVQGVYFVSLHDSKGQEYTKKFVIR